MDRSDRETNGHLSGSVAQDSLFYDHISFFPRKSQSERHFVRRTYLGATSLSYHTDEKLGCQFLDRFSYLKGLYTAPNTPRVFVEIRRVYAKDFIEKKLWIRLISVVTDALKASTLRQSPGIVAAPFLPTLASSLHS